MPLSELLKYIPGVSANWKCAKCGKKYRSEPRECSNCGHTVYDRVR